MRDETAWQNYHHPALLLRRGILQAKAIHHSIMTPNDHTSVYVTDLIRYFQRIIMLIQFLLMSPDRREIFLCAPSLPIYIRDEPRKLLQGEIPKVVSTNQEAV